MIKKYLYHLFGIFQYRQDSADFIPKLQSHRGYCQPETQILENTLASVQKAFELNYKMAEFDVRMTKDQQVILFHDNKIGRFKISKLTLKDLQKKTPVDLLEDVFQWYKKEKRDNFKLNIEIKSLVINGKLEKIIYDLIAKFKMQKYILISSFNPISLAYMNTFDSSIFRSLLLSNEKAYVNNFFIKNMTLNFLARPNALHLRENDWKPKAFKKLLDQKIPIVLWTCNDIDKIQIYFDQKISGVISDKIKPEDIDLVLKPN